MKLLNAILYSVLGTAILFAHSSKADNGVQSSLNTKVISVADTAPPLPPSSPIPSGLLGIEIGMSPKDITTAYGSNQSGVTFHIEHSPIFGFYTELSSLPKEWADHIVPTTGGMLVKRSVYLYDKRVFRIRLEIAGASGDRMNPQDAISAYLALRNSYSERYKNIYVSEKVPDVPFDCEGGSGNARQLIDNHNNANDWGSMAYEDKVILGIHCGASPVWDSDFDVGRNQIISVAIFADDGGGYYSNVVVALEYKPTAEYMIHNRKN